MGRPSENTIPRHTKIDLVLKVINDELRGDETKAHPKMIIVAVTLETSLDWRRLDERIEGLSNEVEEGRRARTADEHSWNRMQRTRLICMSNASAPSSTIFLGALRSKWREVPDRVCGRIRPG